MTRDGKPETSKPRMKKSETLEVRIPHETKQAFLTACREDGTTASEVVRGQVQTYLDARERPQLQTEKRTLVMNLPPTVRRYGPRLAAGGLAAIGLTALAVLPSAAAPDFKAQFSRLDVNGDGVLSVDEFLGPKDAGDDKGSHNVVVETRTITKGPDADAGAPQHATTEMKQQAFSFWLPEELGGAKAGSTETESHEYKFISRSEIRELGDGQVEPEAKVYSFSVDDLRKKEFASIDANGDGKVNLDEFRARQLAMLTNGFNMLDRDKDGSLSQDEYARISGPTLIELDWTSSPDTPAPPKLDIPGMKPASPEAIKAAFTRLDANKDGKLSLQEYLPPA